MAKREVNRKGKAGYLPYWIVIAMILLGMIAAAKAAPCPAIHFRNGEGQDRNCTFFHIAMTPKGRTIELRRNNEWVKAEDVDCTKATVHPPEKQKYYEANSIVARFWCPETIDYTKQAPPNPLSH